MLRVRFRAGSAHVTQAKEVALETATKTRAPSSHGLRTLCQVCCLRLSHIKNAEYRRFATTSGAHLPGNPLSLGHEAQALFSMKWQQGGTIMRSTSSHSFMFSVGFIPDLFWKKETSRKAL